MRMPSCARGSRSHDGKRNYAISIQRVTLRTGRDLRGGCGEITTDCSFNLALLTEPHVEHCTSWTFDSSQRAASN
jgi:hypothetical protein